MPKPGQTQPTIADLALLSAALESDERLSQAERKRRDKTIGPPSGSEKDTTVRAVEWSKNAATHDPELAKLHDQTNEANSWANVFITVLGLLLGWAAAVGVFYFDGNERVNVIAIFATIVLLPAILLIPFLLAAAPRQILAWIPGGLALGGLARGLSPGKLALLVNRLLPRSHRETFARVFQKWERHERLFAGVQKWCVLRWSQLLAVSFQIAAVTAAFCLVVFTDLSFGWSTTLASGNAEQDANRVHALTASIATPWSWAWENAEPTAELVRESRYFRIESRPVSSEEAARLGGWWPFIVMAMLVYGLLPRLITLAWASHRQTSATRHALANLPGLSTVLRRLHNLHLQTEANEPEYAGNAAPSTKPVPAYTTVAGTPDVVINWAEVPVSDALLASVLKDLPVHKAGGSSSLDADANLIKQLGSTEHQANAILILVKSWEPPLAEFTDFLTELRKSIGDGREVIVLPVGAGEGDTIAVADSKHADVWHRCLSRVSDPWLRVISMLEDLS